MKTSLLALENDLWYRLVSLPQVYLFTGINSVVYFLSIHGLIVESVSVTSLSLIIVVSHFTISGKNIPHFPNYYKRTSQDSVIHTLRYSNNLSLIPFI